MMRLEFTIDGDTKARPACAARRAGARSGAKRYFTT